MTLLLSCITADTVYLVSDRRLTSSLPPHPVVDDECNKAVFFEGRVAFAYTGLAEIGGQRTDDWLAGVLADGPSHDMSLVAERIGTRASADFAAMRLSGQLKRHAFLGAGWFRLKGESFLSPGILQVDNAVDHTTGAWLDRALPEFRVGTSFPRELPGGCNLHGVGIVPTPNERGAVTRLVRKCVKHRRSTPRTVEYGLLTSFLWLSSRHHQIGPGLMSVCLPKRAVESSERTGNVMLFAAPPNDSTPTFSYVTATGQRKTFGPHFVSGGGVMTGLTVEPL